MRGFMRRATAWPMESSMLFTRRASAIAGLVLAAAVLAWSLAPEGERVTLSVPAHAERTSAAPPPIATPSRGTAPAPGTPAVAGAAREAAIGASAALRDYGQIVITALNGGTPQQAGEAAKLLVLCSTVPQTRDALEELKQEGRVAAEGADRTIAALDRQERSCQSIPPDLMGRDLELSARAVLGGVKGVATIYGAAVHYAPPEAMRQPLAAALRADFLDGDGVAALMLAQHRELFGLSRVESRAYEIAFDKMDAIGFFDPDRASGAGKPLTDEEQRQAETLAATWAKDMKPQHGHRHG